jgi:hypothetical protein
MANPAESPPQVEMSIALLSLKVRSGATPATRWQLAGRQFGADSGRSIDVGRRGRLEAAAVTDSGLRKLD